MIEIKSPSQACQTPGGHGSRDDDSLSIRVRDQVGLYFLVYCGNLHQIPGLMDIDQLVLCKLKTVMRRRARGAF
jgi:hypothetical protein